MNLANKYKVLQKNPFEFIRVMWGLEPLKEGEIFVKGKHITKQQEQLIQAVKDAVNEKGKKRISVRSGHGVGKSCCLSWLIIWFLFCYPDSQVPCTAPTSEQMHDVLWKELSKWLDLLPGPVKEHFEWTRGYLRILDKPDTWFARAKTARKEAPEALAGVHGDYVFFNIDEGSGVPEEIFNTAEGALTEKNALVVMISNPTRTIGYFYDSHNKDKDNWQCLHFNSEESPLVDKEFVERITSKHGKDSDEYRIRVLGEFPKIDAIDDKGYIPLLVPTDLRFALEDMMFGIKRLGVDPAGEGKNKTAWVVRDRGKAKIICQEEISDIHSITQKTLSIMTMMGIEASNVFVDNFGIGANVSQEMAMAGYRINSVNVGEQANDSERYINKRAESFWRLREWILHGGELIGNKNWQELLNIRYRRELSGKIKIISKKEMSDLGYKSPDFADALMLTFYRPDGISSNVVRRKVSNNLLKKEYNKITAY